MQCWCIGEMERDLFYPAKFVWHVLYPDPECPKHKPQ
jgi:hypothetical protein